MKKILIISLQLLLLNIYVYGNKSYFDWKTERVGNLNYSVRGDGIACDPDGNTFYISTYYGNICMVNYSNNSSTILSGSGFNTVKSGSPLIYGGGRIYYVASNGYIGSLYKSNGVYKNGIINTTFPKARGKGLVYSSPSTIYYVNTSGNIGVAVYNSGYRTVQTISLSEKVHSKCNMTYGGGKLYYTGTSGNIYEVYKSGSYWVVNRINNSSYKSRGDALVYCSNGSLFYPLITDGTPVVIDRLTSATKRTRPVGPAEKARSNTNFVISEFNGGIYYVGQDNYFHTLYYTDNRWQNKILEVNFKARTNTCIYFNKNHIYGSSSSNWLLYKISPWLTEATHPYIYLKGSKFMNKGQEYFPLTMNYSISIIHQNGNTNNIWAAPRHDAYPDFMEYFNNIANNKTNGMNAIRRDFKTIASLGFNSIRLCGVACHESNGEICISVFKHHDATGQRLKESVIQIMSNTTFKNNFYYLLGEIMYYAHVEGLKVILLVGGGNTMTISDKYVQYLKDISYRHRYDSKILAYDIYNEPNCAIGQIEDYNPPKPELNQMVCNWIGAIESIEKNHLITLGPLAAYDGLMNFDPTLMPVDFMSFHLYPYSPYNNDFQQNRRNLKWIRERYNKPWIVGESGYSAPKSNPQCPDIIYNDYFGTEAQQKEWVKVSMKEAIGSGAKGYSYWLLRDLRPVSGKNQRPMGLVTLCSLDGTINYSVNEEKDAANEFYNSVLKNLSSSYTVEPDNYYFIDYSKTYRYTGTVVDENNTPIQGALIYIKYFDHWEYINDKWEKIYILEKTITKSDGRFKLYSKKVAYNMQVSGPSTSYRYFDSSETVNYRYYGYNLITLSRLTSCGNTLKSAEPLLSKNFKTNNANSIKVFPNPSNGIVTITNNMDEKMNVIIYDSSGKIVMAENGILSNAQIDISNLNNGFYFIKVTSENTSLNQKMLLQK